MKTRAALIICEANVPICAHNETHEDESKSQQTRCVCNVYLLNIAEALKRMFGGLAAGPTEYVLWTQSRSPMPTTTTIIR